MVVDWVTLDAISCCVDPGLGFYPPLAQTRHVLALSGPFVIGVWLLTCDAVVSARVDFGTCVNAFGGWPVGDVWIGVETDDRWTDFYGV